MEKKHFVIGISPMFTNLGRALVDVISGEMWIAHGFFAASRNFQIDAHKALLFAFRFLRREQDILTF